MKKLLVTLFTLFSIASFAQSPVAARIGSGYELGMGFAKNKYLPSLTYYQLINLGERKIFSLGWTARLGSFYGNNVDYYTAPARLTRGKTGFSALGAPLVPANIDTINYNFVNSISLNLGIRAQVNLGIVQLGASADLVGITLGGKRTVKYQSSTGQYIVRSSTGADSLHVPFQGASAYQQATPSKYAVRLLGDNDIGTLLTEVYARVRISQRIGIKVGYQWLTTESKVDNRDVVSDNNRFRNRSQLTYVAISLPIFN